MMKILRILCIGVFISAWNVDLPAFSQQKTPEGRAIALIAATNGAVLGAFSVGFIKYHSTWFRLCSSMRDREYSLQGFVDLVLQHATRYPWEEHLRMILGPAIGATAGLVFVSHRQGLGNTPMALVGGMGGLGVGLGLGCLAAQIFPRAHRGFELLAASIALWYAAFTALDFYYPQNRSSPRASHQPTSSAPAMSVTLWNLRF